MQNAERAKNPSGVKPEKGSLPDDAEWHVPQNVRDTWNSASATITNSNLTAVSETSYLPFLFHVEDKASPSFKGRRSFVHGKEVISQPEPAQSSDPPQPVVTKLESDSVSGGSGAGRTHRDVTIKSKKEKRPTSISGFKSSGSATSTLPGKKPVIPASSLIYQDADVGVDLGSMRRAAGHGTGFVKPADIDAPPRPPRSPRKPTVLYAIESDGGRVEDGKRAADDSDNPAQNADGPEDSSRKKRKR